MVGQGQTWSNPVLHLTSAKSRACVWQLRTLPVARLLQLTCSCSSQASRAECVLCAAVCTPCTQANPAFPDEMASVAQQGTTWDAASELLAAVARPVVGALWGMRMPGQLGRAHMLRTVAPVPSSSQGRSPA